jgi:hypothetical protein
LYETLQSATNIEGWKEFSCGVLHKRENNFFCFVTNPATKFPFIFNIGQDFGKACSDLASAYLLRASTDYGRPRVFFLISQIFWLNGLINGIKF